MPVVHARSKILLALATASLFLGVASAPQAQTTQHYCIEDGVSGDAYQWQVWAAGDPIANYPAGGPVGVPAVAAGGSSVPFRDALVNSLNANLPAGWGAAIAFTADHCPGWDTAFAITSPGGTPAPYYLSFIDAAGDECAADGGFCQPDPQVRRFVSFSAGTEVPSDYTFCMNGGSNNVGWAWGLSNVAAPPPAPPLAVLGAYVVPGQGMSGDTSGIRAAFVDSINTALLGLGDAGFPGPLKELGITAGLEYTDAVCPGFDTAMTINTPTFVGTALGIGPAGGGLAGLVGVPPLPGTVAFNPDIGQATGSWTAWPSISAVPLLGVPGLVALGAGLAGLAMRRARRRADSTRHP